LGGIFRIAWNDALTCDNMRMERLFDRNAME
jgi:hypothetical protein